MKDKTLNKETQLRVRLTPHQSFMLDEMCARLELTKSVLVRYMLDQFIKEYNNTEDNECLEQL